MKDGPTVHVGHQRAPFALASEREAALEVLRFRRGVGRHLNQQPREQTDSHHMRAMLKLRESIHAASFICVREAETLTAKEKKRKGRGVECAFFRFIHEVLIV